MAWFVHTIASTNPRWHPYFDFIDKSPEFIWPGTETGYPLTEKTTPPIWSVPSRARLISSHKSLPDIFNLNQNTVVNQIVHDCIVNLEPDLHQFFPIILEKKNGEPFEGAYYTLNISQLIDSIIIEKSNVQLVVAKSQRPEYPDTSYYISKRGAGIIDFRVLRHNTVAGKHLWREKILRQHIFFSDDLHEEFIKKKFKKIDEWFRAFEE